jgi:N-acetylneuraminic acid mutarotase
VAYLFGGVTKDAKGPVNDLYKLDMSDKSICRWTKVDNGKMKPLPRWHHSATYDGRDTIVVFGGYSSDFRFDPQWQWGIFIFFFTE